MMKKVSREMKASSNPEIPIAPESKYLDQLMWGVDILYGIVQMKNEGIVRDNSPLKGDE